jgi:heptosyltransferase II
MKPSKILVFLPNWVGDVVMATPALAALRAHFPAARIVALSRPYVREVLDGAGLVDEARGRDSLKSGASVAAQLRDAWALRRERFDLAILMTNSLRTALFAFVAGARERVGYAREGRSALLTTRLKPLKSDGRYVPSPMIDYYFGLVAAVGAPIDDRRMRLVVTPAEREAAERIVAECGVDTVKPLAILNPGAAFGASKCWPAEYFAAVADDLAGRGFEPLVVTSPKERDIAERILAAAKSPLKPVWRADFTLGAMKALMSRAAVVVTNDSAPRHYAAALGVPVVTLFGPTDERWTVIDYEKELILNKHVECAPCQLKVCPTDHHCMTTLTPDEAIAAVQAVLLQWGRSR